MAIFVDSCFVVVVVYEVVAVADAAVVVDVDFCAHALTKDSAAWLLVVVGIVVAVVVVVVAVVAVLVVVLAVIAQTPD